MSVSRDTEPAWIGYNYTTIHNGSALLRFYENKEENKIIFFNQGEANDKEDVEIIRPVMVGVEMALEQRCGIPMDDIERECVNMDFECKVRARIKPINTNN